jgi:hypothetical protein
MKRDIVLKDQCFDGDSSKKKAKNEGEKPEKIRGKTMAVMLSEEGNVHS